MRGLTGGGRIRCRPWRPRLGCQARGHNGLRWIVQNRLSPHLRQMAIATRQEAI